MANNLKLRASYGQVGNDVYTVGGVAQRFLYEGNGARSAMTIYSAPVVNPASTKHNTLTMALLGNVLTSIMSV